MSFVLVVAWRSPRGTRQVAEFIRAREACGEPGCELTSRAGLETRSVLFYEQYRDQAASRTGASEHFQRLAR